ncbi:MAG: TetR/AcrR family transcriptional regulator [Cyclobacteriaceae bacterium]|nr:TetR/AcrR family transcriptional regulator [Cyclobacteriaceae bacterium HetDA_MAG_MS6]
MRNPEFTKNLIVSRAMSLFNTKGYRATSISDITKASGITKGAIYGNFSNKDDVAVAAFEYAVNKVMKEIRVRIKTAPTAPLKLKAMTHYYEEYIKQPPIDGGCPVINTSIEADDNYPLLRTKVVRFMSMIKDSLKKIIYRGIKENQIKPDVNVDEFTTMFYASIEGAIIMSRVEGDLVSYKQVSGYLDKAIDMITV